MTEQQTGSFEDVQARLNQIVDEVSAEDISLDDALKLYEEAVKLGLSACDLSEQDIDAFVAAGEAAEVSEVSEGEESDEGAAEQDHSEDSSAVEAGSSVSFAL